MAEQTYPQIPATVWWGMRQLLQRSPKAKFDENMLSASLKVQPQAAKQYIAELRRVGILDDENKATDTANKWRIDESYPSAIESIISGAYPEQLVAIAPPSNPDRQTVVNWFMRQGLGEGSAKNKAATYILISSPSPNESTPQNQKKDAPKRGPKALRSADQKNGENNTGTIQPQTPIKGSEVDLPRSDPTGTFPLNVNVQIHISAEATNEQIEAIFRAMKKYLRDA